jgi:hypothetical protein
MGVSVMDLTTSPEYISATAAISALLFVDCTPDLILAYLVSKFDTDIATLAYRETIDNYLKGN